VQRGSEGKVGDGDRRVDVRRTSAKVFGMRHSARVGTVAVGVALTLSLREDLIQAAPEPRIRLVTLFVIRASRRAWVSSGMVGLCYRRAGRRGG
jgi:hypothetical protein